MCVDVDEPIQVMSETKPRAAKEHKCMECGRTIAKGETYCRTTGLDYYHEYWIRYIRCEQCVAACSWLVEVCHGFFYEGVLVDLQEHVAENSYPICTLSLIRLAVYMQRRWRRRNGTMIPVEAVRAWAKSGIRLAQGHAA